MIAGIVSEPTYVLIGTTIHRVWRVSSNRSVCNVDCDLDDDDDVFLKPWRPYNDREFIQGELCEGPETCMSCIVKREVL